MPGNQGDSGVKILRNCGFDFGEKRVPVWIGDRGPLEAQGEQDARHERDGGGWTGGYAMRSAMERAMSQKRRPFEAQGKQDAGATIATVPKGLGCELLARQERDTPRGMKVKNAGKMPALRSQWCQMGPARGIALLR